MDEVLEAEAPLTASWWEGRSSEQLQDMVRGGLAAGEFGAGAHRELERRAREHARIEWETERAGRRRGFRIRMLSVIEAAMLAAIAAVLLIR